MRFNILLLVAIVAATAAACADDDGPPPGAVVVDVMMNTSLNSWLESTVELFNKAGFTTTSDKPVYVVLDSVEAGQAVAGRHALAANLDESLADRRRGDRAARQRQEIHIVEQGLGQEGQLDTVGQIRMLVEQCLVGLENAREVPVGEQVGETDLLSRDRCRQ